MVVILLCKFATAATRALDSTVVLVRSTDSAANALAVSNSTLPCTLAILAIKLALSAGSLPKLAVISANVSSIGGALFNNTLKSDLSPAMATLAAVTLALMGVTAAVTNG